ncbi:hypothetical protein OIDMADRAFT_17432 [Oidiodendron maius Zn]|uniref:Cytochrome b-c1 complex subunit 7 n=1 Tax=Oidiodendron maius (strain Zn) TaxID=913774 RepID=A0A0C3DX61_OIDMZ|nr:hypothetical protein OIDMADRAFT_17432 [Oidiodendron maius Zn]
MSAPSLINFILKRPWLKRALTPVAAWWGNAAGYRQLGLRNDDLIPEESEIVQQALKRLPEKESYDRIFRIRRALQLSLQHQLLPKAEQTKPEEDYHYLSPIIRQIEVEIKERNDLDSLKVNKRK